MIEPKTILAICDFSEAAYHAARRAASVAGATGARLALLCVVDPGPRLPFDERERASDLEERVDDARVRLGRIAAQIMAAQDASVTIEVRAGDPLEEIHRASDAADLLVIGSRNGRPLRELVAGTPAERLVRMVRRPVLVVKRPVESPYRRVLVAVELDEPSPAMLHWAALLGACGFVHLFHAVGGPGEARLRSFGVSADVVETMVGHARSRGRQALHALMESIDHDNVTASIGHGVAFAAALKQQERLDADLTVIGRQRQSALSSFLLGRTAQRVLDAAPSDVLVVPQDGTTASRAACAASTAGQVRVDEAHGRDVAASP